MIDISKTVAPKATNLTPDDLIAGPRTITVTAVKAGRRGSARRHPFRRRRRQTVQTMQIHAPRACAGMGRRRSAICRAQHDALPGRDSAIRWRCCRRYSHQPPVRHLRPDDDGLDSDAPVKRHLRSNHFPPRQQPIRRNTSRTTAPGMACDIAAAESIADLKTVFGTAYKAGRSKAEKDAFKAAYDARTATLTSQEQAA